MAQTVWLGVASSKDLSKTEAVHSWWCLPRTAKPGDRILFYCPRSASASRQGIFAEAEVISEVSPTRPENSYCSGYGAGSAQLRYVDIKIIERFEKKLTAALMKKDPFLSRASIVKKNFQGTTFQLDTATYTRIKTMLSDI